MGLQLLLGGSGYGKSHDMYARVIEESLKHPEKNYFIIVPEQYTMQIQKSIVAMHPDHVVMNIDVVSFGRLAYRIFDELGMETLTILDDIGKSMVIRRVIGMRASQLKVLQGNVKKAGFVSEMKSTISELLQYHVRPDQLLDTAEHIEKRPALTGKLHDIGEIYEGFMSYISEKYMTTEEVLDRLTAVVSKSALIQNSFFYLDEFTGFTPSQYDLIGELLKYGKGMQISLTVDTREDIYTPGKNYQLFYLTRETIARLNRLCSELHVEREEDIVLPKCQRFRENSMLAYLEKWLYRSKFPAKAYCLPKGQSWEDSDIRIFAMHNPSEELRLIIQKIQALSRQGIRYRDIALITGDLSVYGHIAENMMNQAGIPCFIDKKKDVLGNNLAEFLRALLEVMRQDFSYDAMFRYLKTGLTDVVASDINRLENYVLATGVRGYAMWSKPFVRKYRGIAEGELAYVNGIRESVMSWLTPVKEGMGEKPGNAGQYSKVMLDFLEEHDFEQRMEELSEFLGKQGELALSREYQQIYAVIEDIFKRMDEILQDEVMPLRIYADILDAGLQEAKVGIIPPGLDQVVVGDLRRTRLDGIKVLFFIGVNEGLVPGATKDGGLINDRDKEVLAERLLELAPTGRQDSYTERFYIYSMLTKPSLKLYLSFSKVDMSGKTMRPSMLVGRVTKLLPGVSVTDTEAVTTDAFCEEKIYGQLDVRRYLIEGLSSFKDKELPKFWFDLYDWMRHQEPLRASLEQLTDAAFFSHADTVLPKKAVHALYGDILENSVTTLEKYAACAYAHFLSYGLKLEERPEYRLAAPDLGILFHSALELFSKRLSESEHNWHSITDTLRDDLADQCVLDVTADDRHMILNDNYRNRFLIYRLKRMVKRTVWALQKQIQKGEFEPEDYELRFDTHTDMGTLDVALSENEVLRLKGAIDRLDKYEDDNDIYVKIIDYKSGSKRFDVAALYYGLQLQLVVYMEAAMAVKSEQAGGKPVIPAGILYYNINDPMIPVASASACAEDDEAGTNDDEEDVEQSILKSLRMNGLVNEDMKIIKLMDRDIYGQSEVIPAALNKNGTLSRASSAISSETFKKLFKFTSGKVKEIGTNILEGNIEVNPYDRGAQGKGCDYCPYKPICGFDESLEGYAYRKLLKLSKDKAWACICRKEDGDGDDMD